MPPKTVEPRSAFKLALRVGNAVNPISYEQLKNACAMASTSPGLPLLHTRNRITRRRLFLGNQVACFAVVPARSRVKSSTHGHGVVNPFVLVVTTEMLYACPASFSRTATNYRLYDDWGRKFLFAFCDPGSSLRHCFHHCDRSCESLSEGYCLCSKPLPPTSGVLPEASHVPVRMTPPDIIAMITCSKIPTALIEPWPDSSVNDTRPPKLSFC
jgi:hypothetical protein